MSLGQLAEERRVDLVFMGTPAFAATVLDALIAAGHKILAVYTQPPRPAGRGHRLRASPVQLLAERHCLKVRSPLSLRDERVAAEFAALGAAAVVVAAYGLILPRPILTAPRFGCINVHASLLPRWRGAAPIQRALIAGDDLTGITIMAMEEGLDTGPILLQQALPIAPDATAASLSEALAPLGGELVLAALAAAQSGDLASQPQPQTGVTYAHRIEREEGRLDWCQSAEALERRIRALDPWPGAFFEYRGEHIRVHAAAVAPSRSGKPPGTVLDAGLSVACGSGALRLLKLQRPGRAALGVALFLRGYPIAEGTRLPCPATS